MPLPIRLHALLLPVLILCTACAAEAPLSEGVSLRFLSANADYERGAFAEAARGYRSLADDGFDSVAVLYNQGNALFRAGQEGAALAAWERALRRAPGDVRVRENLAFVRRQLLDEDLEAAAGDDPLAAVNRWHQRLDPTVVALILLAAWWLVQGALGVGFLTRAATWRRTSHWVMAAGLAMVLVTGGLLAALSWREGVQQAIVVAESADLQSVPGGGVRLSTVYEGLKVRVRSQRQEWVEVVLPNGARGWLPGKALETV